MKALAVVVVALVGCPGGDAEPDVSACCVCLSESFAAIGEPCLYESAGRCKERLVEGGHPDTWGVCVDDLCGDVCVAEPFDVIAWEP
jgi:hypothetical protein